MTLVQCLLCALVFLVLPTGLYSWGSFASYALFEVRPHLPRGATVAKAVAWLSGCGVLGYVGWYFGLHEVPQVQGGAPVGVGALLLWLWSRRREGPSWSEMTTRAAQALDPETAPPPCRVCGKPVTGPVPCGSPVLGFRHIECHDEHAPAPAAAKEPSDA